MNRGLKLNIIRSLLWERAHVDYLREISHRKNLSANWAALSANWLNPDHIETIVNCFKPHRKFLFKILKERRLFESAYNKNQFPNAFAVVAADCKAAEGIVHCDRARCRKWHLCSRCAAAQKAKARRAYQSAFEANRFLSATISFESHFPNDWLELNRIVPCWEASSHAIRLEHREGRILGAYFSEELALIGFLPLEITAHIHGVFHVEDGSLMRPDQFQDSLRNGIRRWERRFGLPLAVAPSILVKPIMTQAYYKNFLNYITKEITLESKYKTAVQNSPQRCYKANHELMWFLPAWLGAILNRPSVHRIGTMHHSSRNFVGKTLSREPNEQRPQDDSIKRGEGEQRQGEDGVAAQQGGAFFEISENRRL